MLKPDTDRLNYSDLLQPPAGYEVVFAVGTTYSLDLEALIGVPVALSLSEEMDQTFQDDPIYMLEGLRQTKDHLAIFCEAGQIKVPQNGNSLFGLMEDCVFEVALENERSFHPKIWIIKYQDQKQNVLYRLIVLSRNLTFDRSWDMALALEGERESEPDDRNQPLIDFLKFLLPQTTDPIKHQQIQEMAEELPYIRFDSGDKHIPDFHFHPLGINGYDWEDTGIFETYHHLIIMSPFISEAIISKLKEYALTDATQVLITRRSELFKLTEDLLNFFDIYVLKDTIIEGEGVVSEDDFYNLSQLQDIHAKFYARSKYNQHHLYIGSANSSTNAFEGNVEFLLQLQYKKYGFKLIDLLDDFFGEEEAENPFEKIDHLPEEKETETDLQDQLQKAIKSVCRTNAQGYVEKESEDYTIHLSFESIPEDVDFTIGPLLSKKKYQLEHKVILDKLQLLEIGEFYVVKAQMGEEVMGRVIKIPTQGIPDEREQAIFRSIINNPVAFLQYVAFLLSDDFLLAALEQMEQNNNKGFVDWNSSAGQYPILYENMLKAASRTPEKMEDILHVMELINDDVVIPDQFFRLYETFNNATKMVKK
ncbi:phospholipase D family protein [Halobacillus salinarum]|uniref:Phospholipase D family protein n=1 Tax=Halobacillus salinarum TaxID=2932257 RepID=A0ABY4EL98_9BACI|nr:phospholipase D family protein [Halobacillus salinarum]UOQ44851.1 phospholipase D family protein [Halobacillus salinarum]